MKLSHIGTFTLGVVFSAISIGAVTYVNAAGDANIKACADKNSGAMRYIAKGKCKKTEKTLTWNQMGPQGLTGAAGSAGAKGDAGSTGTNGQNLFLMNSDGTTVGQVTQAAGSFASFMSGGLIWDVNTQNGQLSSSFYIGFAYKDAACTVPFGTLSDAVGVAASPQAIGVQYGANDAYDLSDKVYKAIGKGFTFASQPTTYALGVSGCTEMTSQAKTQNDTAKQTLFEVVEITTRPSFVLPLTVVAK